MLTADCRCPPFSPSPSPLPLPRLPSSISRSQCSLSLSLPFPSLYPFPRYFPSPTIQQCIMQSHIETVDPKFLDLRQFPLRLNRATEDLGLSAQCSDDIYVGDDIDFCVGGNSIYNRRSSSIDQLDILGPFELSPSNSNSTNSDSSPTYSSNWDSNWTLDSITNTKTYNFLSRPIEQA